MNNLETVPTLRTEDTGRRKKTTQKTKNDEQHILHQKVEANPCGRDR